jgi:hypothetical protein
LGIIVILLSGYGLITKNFVAQPFMMLALSAFILVGGIDELKQGKKPRGFISIVLSVFVFFVLVQSFFF